MPNVSDILSNQKKKKFKKVSYRPWSETEPKAKLSPPAAIQTRTEKVLKNTTNNNSDEIIRTISPENIRNWEFADRPESELGDIDALAKEFLDIGQQLPCIVRPIKESEFQYELIVGERRWKAAEKASIDLKVIIKKMSDEEAALIQAAENSSRQDLSDYARGMSYAKLIGRKILKQRDLTEKLSISKQEVSRLLSFSKIPTTIFENVADFTKVSSRTATEICRLANKGHNYIEAIIDQAENIRNGTLGHNKLNRLVEKHLNSKKNWKRYFLTM